MTAFEINPPAPSVDIATALSNIAHKFGGSSLADSTRIRHVAELVRTRSENTQVVVVSAMQGVTDALLALSAAAAENLPQWRDKFGVLRKRHLDTAQELLGDRSAAACAWLDRHFDELTNVLNAIAVLRGAGHGVAEAVSGNGEVWSSYLLHALLRVQGADYSLLDAREVLVVRDEELGVAVDWEATDAKLAAWRAQQSAATRNHHRLCRARRRRPRHRARPQRQRLLRRNFCRIVSSRKNCTSGPMSTACSAPIRASSPRRSHSRR